MTGVVAVSLLPLAPLASAAIIETFTLRSEWASMTGDRTDIDFEVLGLAPGAAINYSTSDGLSIGGLTVTGVTSSGYLL
jgi:hypothetical protein